MPLGATTGVKNSGILRFTYGGNLVALPAAPQFPAIAGQNVVSGAVGTLIQVLGADALVTPDSDDQVFGLCPGHAAITGLANTFFTGSAVAQQNMVTPGRRVLGVNALFDKYIPAGAKVTAWFQLTNVLVGTSTVAAEMPIMCVQTEVQTNRRFRAGVVDTTGPQFVSSIRVAVRNLGDATTLAAGVLFVRIEHSEHDIPGENTQDENFSTSSID